jgi:predicted GNAT superfamily acetyltransferase
VSLTLTLRPLTSQQDFDSCVALQRATWGDDFRELVPPALLLVAQKVGGIAAGAFEGDRLLGFVYGLTGIEGGRPVHWSHMLAVDERFRDHGIGRRLKRYQRERLAAMGVERMYWTFDPLVARNAHLNLEILGARVVEYARDLYGENPMSRADSVIGSDRFVVAWDLSPAALPTPGGHGRPRAATGGHGGSAEQPLDRPGAQPLVAPETDPLPDAPSVLIAIPADIQALKLQDPDAALAWRRATRRAFEHYLGRGYAVRGVARDPGGDGSRYRVERSA